MSSYQHQCILGNYLRDSLPDYLTCGYCAKEFLLDNITLFIAHKMRGCDKSSHVRTSSLTRTEDTSAPLTCSSCSRVFMTARGFLHHVQEDHKMALYLQKGPIYVPEQGLKPPPAHFPVNANEFSTTNRSSCCRHNLKTRSSTDHSEQPTDLSMTCSDSLSKARVKCSKDKYKIMIEPINSLVSAQTTRPGSAVPKKRKFVFPPRNDIDFTRDLNISSDSVSGECDIIYDAEDSSSRNGNVFLSRPPVHDTKTNSNMHITVAADYQKDTLCGELLSTEKKEPEKHAKLKRLLQTKTPTPDQDEISIQNDTTTTTVVYKVPFLSPQNLELSTCRESSEKFADKMTSFFEVKKLSAKESQVDSPRSNTDRILPESTLEQNIDYFIKASLASDYSEDLEIIHSLPISSSFPGKNLKGSRSALSFPSVPFSPRLLIPGEKENNLSQPFFNYPSLGFLERRKSMSDTLQGKKHLSDENSSNTTTCLMTLSTLSSLLQTKNPFQIDLTSSQTGISSNLLNLANTLESESSFPDSETSETYYETHILKDNNINSPRDKQNNILLGSNEEDVIMSEKSTNDKIRPLTFTPSVPVGQDSSIDGSPGQQLSGTQHDDVIVLSGSTPKSRSTREVLDSLERDGLDGMDTDDISGLDIKVFKKRRYPTSRPFKCGSCDQAFNQRIHLKKHMSKHTGVKPFKCQQCDYSTVERSHLKVHYRIHTGEKPYRCMHCDYATAQNSTLKIHLKRHHEGQSMSDPSRLSVNSQLAESLDEDEVPEPATLSGNISNQSNGKNLSQSSSLPDRRIPRSSSPGDLSQTDARRGGNNFISNKSSSSDSAPLLLEPQIDVNLLHQTQDDNVTKIRDKHALESESRKQHNLKPIRSHHDIGSQTAIATIINAAEIDKTYQEKLSAVNNQSIVGQQDKEPGLVPGRCTLVPYVTSNTIPTTDVQPDSSHSFLNKSGDNVTSKGKELLYLLNNRQHSSSKSLISNEPQNITMNNLECAKYEKDNKKHSASYDSIRPDSPGQRDSVLLIENGKSILQVATEKAHEHNDDHHDPAFNQKEDVSSMDISSKRSVPSHQEQEAELKENNELDNSRTMSFVSIPEKAFVRG